jgi:putative DNA primase/helicase
VNEINPTDLARNRWRSILPALGIDEAALTGNHTACPMCGGEDRFRFDNNDGAGTYYCNGCGAGTGYKLVMGFHSVDFQTALRMVKEVVSPEMPEDRRPRELDATEKRASLNRLWRAGELSSGWTVEYLTKRGLSVETAAAASQSLRYTNKAWLRDESAFMPAVLALVTRLSGQPVSIHRTFLLPDGGRVKKMMPAVGDIMGAGIFFGPRTESKWVVGEGIETTLAGWEFQSHDGTAVSAVSAGGLEALEVPDHVNDLVILADNDASFAGMRAAAALAHRVSTRKAPCKVAVMMPKRTGRDMLDELVTEEREINIFRGGRHE